MTPYKRIVCCVISIWIWNQSSGQLIFTDKAAEQGIFTEKNIGTVGHGVSFRDFNGDGWDDITLATEEGQPIDFYININGAFQKIDPLIENKDDVRQILWVDFDNDGDSDLYIATIGAPNRLYEATDSLQFKEVTERSGLSMKINASFGATWGDVNRDGHLDLYYSDRKTGNWFEQTEEDYNQNQLYINNGDRSFSKVSISSNTNDPKKIPFCSSFFDYNNDLWPDIYTANDKLTTNTLLRNEGNCTFSDMGAQSRTNARMNAMCVAIGDYNNDGWQDIYSTNTPVGNKLFRNGRFEEPFEDATHYSGTGYYGNGWGAVFLDGNNDGFLDLYVCGSMVGSDVISNVFYRNLGDGTFDQPDFGFEGDTTSSYVNVFGDINQDGYPDIVVQNNKPYNTQLWANSGADNNWLKVKLTGQISNRDAVGSHVILHADGDMQTRYTHCGLGYLGQNTSDVMFGLGESSIIDSLIIKWPSGHIDIIYDIDVNQRLTIQEGISSPVSSNISSGVCKPDAIEGNEFILGKDNADAGIVVYPNPVYDRLFLSNRPEHLQPIILIRDLSGKMVLKTKISENQIDISLLKPGIYLAMLTIGGDSFYQKFVKK